MRVDAVKIGMIARAEIAEAVARALSPHGDIPIVLDPVMVAKGGAALLDLEAVTALTDHLLPLATHLTPNLPEAATLLGCSDATTREDMQDQAEALRALGPRAVLLKGGHLAGDRSPDLLCSQAGMRWFDAARVDTVNTHGTGCTLSAALAAELAMGASDIEAVATAKSYVTGAVACAEQLTVGHGHGPTHHFHALWPTTPHFPERT